MTSDSNEPTRVTTQHFSTLAVIETKASFVSEVGSNTAGWAEGNRSLIVIGVRDATVSVSSLASVHLSFHLEFARDVTDHRSIGKEYEVSYRKLHTISRRCETLNTAQTHLVLESWRCVS